MRRSRTKCASCSAVAPWREKKEWALSDSLRDQLLAMGWRIKDTKEGQKVSRRG